MFLQPLKACVNLNNRIPLENLLVLIGYCYMAAFHSETGVDSQLILSEHAQKLVVSDKRSYLEKVARIGDPYCIPRIKLSKEEFPPMQTTDIFNYLVLGSIFCPSQQFKAYKSLEAYRYFECGLVNCLGSKRCEEKNVTVAKVCLCYTGISIITTMHPLIFRRDTHSEQMILLKTLGLSAKLMG